MAIKFWVVHIAKLPTISNIEVAAVICALITMVLMFLSVVDLDDTAGAIFLGDGSSFLKLRQTRNIFKLFYIKKYIGFKSELDPSYVGRQIIYCILSVF